MAHFFLEDCEKLAALYEAIVVGGVKECAPDYETDTWDSIKFFLRGYAFERRGRPADYSVVAVHVIDQFMGKEMSEGRGGEVWAAVERRLMKLGIGLNHANNPMCPKGTCYERKYKGEVRPAKTNGFSAVEFVVERLGGRCIVPWAHEQLATGDAETPHRMVCEVNGVSVKVAPFFLRDVATLYGVASVEPRALLQPIDKWIRFVVQRLAGDDRMGDPECAAYVVENSGSPEKLNQGIWFFCTQVALSSMHEVVASIEDHDYTRDLIRQYLRRQSEIGRIVAGHAMP